MNGCAEIEYCSRICCCVSDPVDGGREARGDAGYLGGSSDGTGAIMTAERVGGGGIARVSRVPGNCAENGWRYVAKAGTLPVAVDGRREIDAVADGGNEGDEAAPTVARLGAEALSGGRRGRACTGSGGRGACGSGAGACVGFDI